MGGYIDWHMHKHKARVFADLPPNVVELGSGVGQTCGICRPGRA